MNPAEPGDRVALQVEAAAGGWSTVATGTVGQDGSFVIPAAPAASGTYRVRSDPAGGLAAALSAPFGG